MKLTLFNDIWYIWYLLLGYIGLKKFGRDITIVCFLAYQLIDFILRLIVTFGIWCSKEIAKIITIFYKEKEPTEEERKALLEKAK